MPDDDYDNDDDERRYCRRRRRQWRWNQNAHNQLINNLIYRK